LEGAAREIELLRASTAAELERVRASAASAAKKTAWDKAAILIQAIATLAIIVPLIALYESIHQFDVQQGANATQILDQQRQATLSGYLDDMSALVLQDKLPSSKPGDPVRAIAEARTLTAVRNLDGHRKGTLIRYLWEARLITRPQPIVDIPTADLTGAVFNDVHLEGVVLSQLGLNNTQFADAQLVDADLSGSVLFESDLMSANLSRADLSNSAPIGAALVDATLTGANLKDAELTGANLTGARLAGSNLNGARYNSKPEYVPYQGKFVLEEPTRWPSGFDPRTAGAICYDCHVK
jgi:hypothetical protein